jgi:hypothetical protein
MDKNKMYEVKNRSSSVLAYSIPDEGIKRTFQPGETKKLSFAELEKLTYQSGGQSLINNYFLIKDADVIQDLNVRTEPEYYLTEPQIVDLIKNGSVDQFLDCLDFAPAGVIELVKDLSIKVPLSDYQKRQALKDKIGFDVDAALRHIEEEKAEMKAASENDIEPAAPKRRVTTEAAAPGRRTDGKYKIVSQDNK